MRPTREGGNGSKKGKPIKKTEFWAVEGVTLGCNVRDIT
jgi:hypothetical protein